MATATCGNCSKDAEIFPDDAVELINKYTGGTATSYCVKCGKDKYLQSLEKLNKDKEVFNEYFKKKIMRVPTLTIENPKNWDYESIGIVTGSVSIGMGIMGDLSSTFANLTGGQSSEYNQKISSAEHACLNQIRLKALNMGGNAVLGVDIDYSEVGGGKGLLMVSANGTAIKLKNTEILGEEKRVAIDELSKKGEELEPFLKFKTYKL